MGTYMKIAKQLDKIFEETNQKLEEGKFDEINEWLKGVDVENEPIEILIGWLTTCLCVYSKLPYIDRFYERVEEKLEKEEPGRAKAILHG